jgi:hypothetical protein
MPFNACYHLFRTCPLEDLYLLAHGAGSPLAEISFLSLGFGDALGEGLSIFILILRSVSNAISVLKGYLQQHPWFSQHYDA